MTKRSSRSSSTRRKSQSAARSAWKGQFVPMDFSADQRKDIKAWADQNAGNLSEMVEQHVDEGWSFRISKSADGQLVFVSVTIKDDDDPDNGLTLSVKFPGYTGALTLACYVIGVMWERGEVHRDYSPPPDDWL